MTDGLTKTGCMHLEPNGVIGFHEAVVPQLLLIVSGEGLVRSDNDPPVHIKAGEAAFWKKGEGHETTTETGLTAIVIEAEELSPAKFMTKKDTEL